MGLFNKMGGVTPTGSSRWFHEGSYLARVRRCQHFMSQQDKGNCVAIEVTILHIVLGYEAGRICWIDQSELPASNRVGEVCSTVLQLDRQKPAMANLKGFLLAASGLTEAQIIQSHAKENKLDPTDPRTADDAFDAFATRCTAGTGEALAGALVAIRANRIRTKAGTPFTRVVWEVPSAEVMAAYKAAPAPAAEAEAAPADGAAQ
jgi:hypothetical protein